VRVENIIHLNATPFSSQVVLAIASSSPWSSAIARSYRSSSLLALIVYALVSWVPLNN
jgi:hypothetical protein